MGYDAGKKVKGRKIHALVDTEGLPLRVTAVTREAQARRVMVRARTHRH